MIINLQPTQVVAFWDAVKHAIIQVKDIPAGQELSFTNKTLEQILAGKYQCWVVYTYEGDTQNKHIHAVGLTALVDHPMYGYRALSLELLYGFRPLSDEIMLTTFKDIMAFAKANGCSQITLETSSKRIEEMARLVGFAQESVRYSMPI